MIKNVCNHFFEMPENTIREQTFCCGGGAGLGTDENMEMRLRGGLPRGNAVRHVQEKHGVNRLAAMCAIDRATLVTVCDYWAPGVKVTGITELVANAMVFRGEKKRTHEPALGADPGHGRGRGREETPTMNDKPRILVGLVVGLGRADVSVLVHAGARASPAAAAVGTGQAAVAVRGRPSVHAGAPHGTAGPVARMRWSAKASGPMSPRLRHESYEMSLTKTCMGCHASRRDVLRPVPRLCERSVLAVLQRSPWRAEADGIGCWDCHVAPKEK